MKLLAWNVRGLGHPRMFNILQSLVQDQRPSILFLAETKTGKDQVESLRVKLGFSGNFVVEAIGRSGGLSLFWKDDVKVDLMSFSCSHIDVSVSSHEDKKWRFTGVYGHPNPTQRHQFWTLLRRIRSNNSIPWLCGGDFNEILLDSEKRGGGSRAKTLIHNFRQTLAECNLEDMGFNGPCFTWSNKQDSNLIQERLDRFVSNPKWRHCFKFAKVTNLEFWRSDHRPIAIDFHVIDPSQRIWKNNSERRFHFEACWMEEAECQNLIKEEWAKWSYNSNAMLSKLERCQLKLMDWNIKARKELKNGIKSKRLQLKRLSKEISPGSWHQINKVEKELDALLSQEELYWKQRSRIEWLKSGDKNTRFFHLKASSRRARNRILGLYNESGRWCDNQPEVEQIAATYFSNLFQSNIIHSDAMDLVLETIPRRLSSQKANNLLKSFSAAEVKKALFDMAPLKAPGPDGFPAIFFQQFWETVGVDVVNLVLGCLNENRSMEALNNTLIVLIPKVKEASKMSEFRPISLCNVIYKVISKTLANRMRGVLDDIISKNQSAFVPGRLITDNALIGFECLNVLKRRKKDHNGSFALKLDMAKAYDRVEWAFIKGVMEKLGFPHRWITIIINCISTVSYSIKINGCVSGKVIPSRGLRQGDPLSPYLFLLCAEGLSCLIDQAICLQKLDGFRCSRGGPIVSHLFFADDCLLFSKASKRNYEELKRIIHLYSQASGQLVNFQKSAFCVSKGLDIIQASEMAASLNVRLVDCHERYLGLPCFAGRNKRSLFQNIIDKMWCKIKGWKGRALSGGGREVMIKSVLQAIPVYPMNLFKLPSSIISELHAVLARFWWGGSDSKRKCHWGSWERLCKAKSEGGLGFRNLHAFNRALLAKQGWRLLKFPNSLVAQVLKGCYFRTGSFLEASHKGGESFTWRSLLWGRGLLEKGCRWRIGDGKAIFIYKDNWIPRPSTFKVISPPVLSELATVNQLMLPSGGWNEDLLNQVFLPMDADIIRSIPLSSRHPKDMICWHYEKYGEFSVRSGYRVECGLSGKDPSSSVDNNGSWWKCLWGLNIPSKIKLFIWKACRDWIPSFWNLLQRGMDVAPACPMCKGRVESSLHVLWCCPQLKHLHKLSGLCLNWLGNDRDSVKSLFEFALVDHQKQEIELLCIILWRVWFRRNKWVHNSKHHSLSEVWEWSLSFLKEFQKINSPSPPKEPQLPSSPLSLSTWAAPDRDCLKLNTDAAMDVSNGKVGLGVVIRDSNGEVVLLATKSLKASFPPEIAEAMAILYGLTLAVEAGIIIQFVESDALSIVALINQGVCPCSELGSVLTDIFHYLDLFPNILFSHVFRSANCVAHATAKLAVSLDSDKVWLEEVPSCLCNVLLGDMPKPAGLL